MLKNWIIAALVATIATGGALSALAVTQQTTANVEVTVWQRISDGSLFLSTRPEGGRWTTHNTPLDMSARSSSGNFRQGSAIRVAVPVTVEVAEEYAPVIASNWDDLTPQVRYHAREDAFLEGAVRTDIRMRGENRVLNLDAICFPGGNAGLGFLFATRDGWDVDEGTQLLLQWRLNDEAPQQATIEVALLGQTPGLYFLGEPGFQDDWPNVMAGGTLTVRTQFQGVLEDEFDLDAFRQAPVYKNLADCGDY